jgi:dTDP-4-dehydrorhamnose reductase
MIHLLVDLRISRSGFASEFPWVQYYTPINEPLTTARFSGLYGLWYPHHANDISFLRMLINQVKAIKESMRAIRRVNPYAQLIQTEDLAKTHSTSLLQYQADFENDRRWLSYDLLTGKIDESHPLWKYLISNGITIYELEKLQEDPCQPSIAGFNYYPTSERYLDENLNLYPQRIHGGNAFHNYADTEAIRIPDLEGTGRKTLLKEAWDRYKIPLALTEVHLGCHREEQLRWLYETWTESLELVKEGVNIKAITSWSLLGAFNWNSLLVENQDYYESGAFDIRSGNPRPTAVANMIKAINQKGRVIHPLLEQKGWWHRTKNTFSPGHNRTSPERPLMIVGKSGSLAKAFANICQARYIHAVALGSDELNICDVHSLHSCINKYKPWGIINCAGYVKVDEAEIEKEKCYQINTSGATLLATVCAKMGIPLVTFSSDLVFGGDQATPYSETDEAAPLNTYGDSKYKAERGVISAFSDALIIRSSAFFSPWDQYNFAYQVQKDVQLGKYIDAAEDVIISPTYLPDLVNNALDLFIDRASGLWHISNQGSLSWSDFAKEVITRSGKSLSFIRTRKAEEMEWNATVR